MAKQNLTQKEIAALKGFAGAISGGAKTENKKPSKVAKILAKKYEITGKTIYIAVNLLLIGGIVIGVML